MNSTQTTSTDNGSATEVKENHETFFARLKPLLAPSEYRTVTTAYTIAKDRHRGQVRKEMDSDGVPIRYFEHVRAVTIILIEMVGCVDTDVICASLLHDTREDTRLTDDDIEHIFNTRVARTVTRLTKIPKEGYHQRLFRYGEWEELCIKACDRLHNVRTLASGSPEWQQKQIKETITVYFPILDRLLEVAPAQYTKGVMSVRDEIHKLIAVREAALKVATP